MAAREKPGVVPAEVNDFGPSEAMLGQKHHERVTVTRAVGLRQERRACTAAEFADRAAAGLVDKSMPVEERQRRKRALIKAEGISRYARRFAEAKS
jgi:hypothetical protein